MANHFSASILFTSYNNGTVRDTTGRLVAYYDEANQTLDIDGWPNTIHGVDSLEFAMDLIVSRLSNPSKVVDVIDQMTV